MEYDPEAKGGKGQLRFKLKSDRLKPEEFENKDFVVDLPAGFKEEGATFDRFGLMNAMKAGGPMTIYFGELEHDGKREDLSREPHWESSGNRESYEDRDQVGANNFGFSADTRFAGG